MSRYCHRSHDFCRYVLVLLCHPVRFALFIALALTASFASERVARADNRMASSPGMPEPPETGTPEGHTQPGTRRPEATCKETDIPLTALIANNGSDFTISEHPTFLFYVPYQSADIRYMEFMLLDEGERETIYRTGVRLEDEPGIVQVQLPEEPDYALVVGENYRWYFKLDCLPDRSEAPDLVVDGWVRYVGESGSEEGGLDAGGDGNYLGYAECEYWYDAISTLAGLRFAAPENPVLAEDWSELLELLGHGLLDEFPLADSTVLAPED